MVFLSLLVVVSCCLVLIAIDRSSLDPLCSLLFHRILPPIPPTPAPPPAPAPPLRSLPGRYGVPYGVSPTPPELLEAWSRPNEAAERCLKLPGPNIFIPDDFSLVCDRDSDSDSGGATKGEGATAAKVAVDPEEGFEEEAKGERYSPGCSDVELRLSVHLAGALSLTPHYVLYSVLHCSGIAFSF